MTASPLRACALFLSLLLAACAGRGEVLPQADAGAVSAQVAEAAATQPVEPAPAEAAQDASAGSALEDGAPSNSVPADGVPTGSTPADGTAAEDAAPGEVAVDATVRDVDGAPADAAAATQAEQDYAAIYGGAQDPYNPIADPTLPAPAQLATSYDPWERYNRRMHAFNNAIDRRVARPLAKAYVAAVPRPVRLGIGNFFNNLGQPVSALNALLQGKPKNAGQALGRFAVNATLGVGGFLDPASKFSIPNRSEDFGQTLGVWGWKKSRYVELPLFGPRTVRDVFGLVGDSPMAPLQYIELDKARVFTQGLQLVDLRTQLMAVDSMREGATDEYALFRDAWMQRRQYQIFGDREQSSDDLPDYLKDDTDTYIPVDVMPVVPGGAGY